MGDESRRDPTDTPGRTRPPEADPGADPRSDPEVGRAAGDQPTEDTPLVVPVSDAIGAVELRELFDDEPDADPAGAPTGVQPSPVQAADAPTVRHAAATDAPTVRQAAAADAAGAPGDLAPTELEQRSAHAAPTPVGGTPAVAVAAAAASDEVHGRPRRRWLRRVALGTVVLLVVALGYYGFTLWQGWSTGRSDEARPVDAIVVMGAAQYDGRPSPQLEARLDHVLTLWADGIAPTVIVTGGNQPGDRFTEAETSGAFLIEGGVPADAILYENAGSNTYDSLVGVASIMDDRDLDTAVIVTDPYHALRSQLTAEELGISASSSPTPNSVVTGGAELRRELGEAAGVALGRIIGFDRLASLSG